MHTWVTNGRGADATKKKVGEGERVEFLKVNVDDDQVRSFRRNTGRKIKRYHMRT